MQRKRHPSLEARRVARIGTSLFAVAALSLFLSCFSRFIPVLFFKHIVHITVGLLLAIPHPTVESAAQSRLYPRLRTSSSRALPLQCACTPFFSPRHKSPRPPVAP